MSVVLSLADFDLPTRSASGYLVRWIVPRASLEPATLYALLAQRTPFRLSAPQSDIIIGMGHGSTDVLTGQNEAIILEIGKYDPKEVRGKVIYLLSCQTGVLLGPDLIKNGAASFIGFTDDFVWVCDADLASRPWADKMAAKCLMPVVESINALLDGKTAREAFETELAQYDCYAEVEDDELVKSCIEFNKMNAVLLGDPEARVRRRPRIVFPVPPPPLIMPLRSD